jgi:glycerol kinase
MAQKYIMAIDQGTTGSTVLIVDVTSPLNPSVMSRHTIDFTQHFPKPGWVEHDLNEIWESVVTAANKALEKLKANRSDFALNQIQCLGITNQRETLCVFDRATAKPVTRAIVWQCKRSIDIVKKLRADGVESMVREKTGLVLDPYFSGSKLAWVLANNPEAAAKIKSGQAVVGTIDTYLMARLTGGKSFVTEASNASRTMLFNIGTGTWDKELTALFGVKESYLPEVKDSAGEFGRTHGLSFLPDGIPISGALGDQQAALAGQTCFKPGEAKCTYGTGAFLLMNIGSKKMLSNSGMLTTIAWGLSGKLTYALEGSSFIAGAAIQFLRDQLGLVKTSAETEHLAKDVIGAPEVYFVPALSGLGAPYWDPMAQGAFFGLTRGTSKNQLVRAALEGIAFEVADLTRAMASDTSQPLTILKVDGGAAANNLLMQTQADLSGVGVDRPVNLETTAFGAALFAGYGAKIYTSLDQMSNARKTAVLFKPDHSTENTKRLKEMNAGWNRAVKAVRTFAGTV